MSALTLDHRRCQPDRSEHFAVRPPDVLPVTGDVHPIYAVRTTSLGLAHVFFSADSMFFNARFV
jgi:hypothetical protein